MHQTASGEECEPNFVGFWASKKKQHINDLLSFAREMIDPDAKDLATRVDEDKIEEWMIVDDDDAPVVHYYTDSEIIEMVVSPEQHASEGESDDQNEEDVAERISIDRLIQLTGELLKGLEQRNFISKQEIINIYMLQDKLIKERPRHMKQLSLQDIFKRIAKKRGTEESSIKNPVPLTSA